MACQGKNQAMRWKELSVELWDRIVSRHRSGERYQKDACNIEGSQEYSGPHHSKMEEVSNHQVSSYNWPPAQTEQSVEKGLGQGQ